MDDITLARLLMGALIGLSVYFAYKILQNVKTIRSQSMKFAGLDLATEASTCKGPHTWDQIQLAMRELPVALHTVCTQCGLVGGTGYKLNIAAMDIYKRNLDMRARQKAKQDRRDELSKDALEEVAKAMESEGIESETAKYFLGMYKDRLWNAAVKTSTEFPDVD